MKLTIFSIILFFLSSCSQDKTLNSGEAPSAKIVHDTVIVKHENVLNTSFEVETYSKGYSYYWKVGNDTLDFFISAKEDKSDSSLHLSIHHKKPFVFLDLLDKLNKCLPLIKDNFRITRLSSVFFKSPIFYLDLTRKLSREYEEVFGKKNVSYQQFSEFMLSSSLNKQLDNFLNPLNKKVKRISIEKFHILEKKYFSNYLPNTDLKNYPEFTIDGMGVYVHVESK